MLCSIFHSKMHLEKKTLHYYRLMKRLFSLHFVCSVVENLLFFLLRRKSFSFSLFETLKVRVFFPG